MPNFIKQTLSIKDSSLDQPGDGVKFHLLQQEQVRVLEETQDLADT
jgi:hypothetical protein